MGRFERFRFSVPVFRAENRNPTTKISPRIPCLNPPSFRGLQGVNFFVFGLFFSLKCRKNAHTKNFEGGEGGGKQIFVLDFFGCFFRSLGLVPLRKGIFCVSVQF